MSPHPHPPPLSGFNPIMSRRVLFGGATAVAAAGVLSACGSSSSKTEHKASETPFYEINEQDASKLKQGGTLTLAATALGPNFNLQTQSGYTSSNLDALAPCNIPAVMGFYTMSPDGEGTLNPEFCTEHKTEHRRWRADRDLQDQP